MSLAEQAGEDAEALLRQLMTIYDVKTLVAELVSVGEQHWSAAILKRVVALGRVAERLRPQEVAHLATLLPSPPAHHPHYGFRFIDLFAGIGGIRSGFEAIGGQCVFTSEWNKHAVRTYKANWYCDPQQHRFNEDIRDITLSQRSDVSDEEAARHIRESIPQHDVLLAGFPCQPFSLAGVSKKNAMGRAHGFACETQGTLFFDVVRIIAARQPAIFVLENVKNLKSHDQGRTFRIIMQTLDELGYEVADAGHTGPDDPKVIDGRHFLPQHRERIVLVGFRRDLQLHAGFTLRDIAAQYPAVRQHLASCWSRRSMRNLFLRRCCGNIFIVMPASIRRGAMALVMAWLTPPIPTAWPGRFLPATIKMVPKFSSIAAGTCRSVRSILTIR